MLLLDLSVAADTLLLANTYRVIKQRVCLLSSFSSCFFLHRFSIVRAHSTGLTCHPYLDLSALCLQLSIFNTFWNTLCRVFPNYFVVAWHPLSQRLPRKDSQERCPWVLECPLQFLCGLCTWRKAEWLVKSFHHTFFSWQSLKRCFLAWSVSVEKTDTTLIFFLLQVILPCCLDSQRTFSLFFKAR